MATRRVVTKRRIPKGNRSPRTALDSQPLSQWTSQSEQKLERTKENRRYSLTDAEAAVEWLNNAKGASYRRVAALRQELESLPVAWSEHSSVPPWRRLPKREGGNSRDEFDKEHRELAERHDALNNALSEYVFRPRVTHLVFRGTWHFGMVPDQKKRWFQIKITERTISEADVVMSLVRLASTWEIGKVHLCEMCKQRWHVAAKRNYKFCSEECRISFYKTAPEYHQTKAATQRRYRARLKEMGFRL
jgi:hypothetical protein